jgi:hypothetical protein
MPTHTNGASRALNGKNVSQTSISNGSDTVHSSHNGASSHEEPSAQLPGSMENEKSYFNGIPHQHESASRGSQEEPQFPRISLPVQMMRNSYDVVVIGTGYGGSVAASRLARGKQSVCVLERGKERWPGEFPETIKDAAKELRVTGEFAPGDRRSIPGKLIETGSATGLYHFAVGDGQNVYMGNGLGGTSLVNANVFLEATRTVLDMEVWPKELRGVDEWRKCESNLSFRTTDIIQSSWHQ